VVRLIATDLDGTLLRSDKTVSDRTLTTLRRIQAHGIPVILVSARQPRGVQLFAERMGVSGPAVCCNGSITYDLSQSRILRHTRLEAHVLLELVRLLRASVPGVCFAFVRGLEFACEAQYHADARLVDHGEVALRTALIADAVELCGQPATKLIVRHPSLLPEDILTSLGPLGSDRFEASYSGGPFVEIAAAGVTKAVALQALCDERQIDASDVVAFGDAPNDVPMLAWAGRGVAVGNAHPAVLTVADEVAPSNDDDGVAVVLEAWLEQCMHRS
jgi:HAD superfamily hydrolase (TIGR01484 family)